MLELGRAEPLQRSSATRACRSPRGPTDAAVSGPTNLRRAERGPAAARAPAAPPRPRGTGPDSGPSRPARGVPVSLARPRRLLLLPPPRARAAARGSASRRSSTAPPVRRSSKSKNKPKPRRTGDFEQRRPFHRCRCCQITARRNLDTGAHVCLVCFGSCRRRFGSLFHDEVSASRCLIAATRKAARSKPRSGGCSASCCLPLAAPITARVFGARVTRHRSYAIALRSR